MKHRINELIEEHRYAEILDECGWGTLEYEVEHGGHTDEEAKGILKEIRKREEEGTLEFDLDADDED